MIGKIDRFGRLIIPKGVRDRLGLHNGDSVDIIEEAGQVRIMPAASRPEIRRAEDGLLVLCAEPASIPGDPIQFMREARERELLQRGAR